MRLLHGKPLAEKLHEASRQRSAALKTRGVTPRLAIVSVGADPAANTYAQRLETRGTKLDIAIDDVALARTASERELVATLEKLSADPRTHALPVMIVSYKDRPEDRLRGLEAGASFYLPKGGFEDRALLDAVNDLIGEAEP